MKNQCHLFAFAVPLLISAATCFGTPGDILRQQPAGPAANPVSFRWEGLWWSGGVLQRILPDGTVDPGFTAPSDIRTYTLASVNGKALVAVPGMPFSGRLELLKATGERDGSFTPVEFQGELSEVKFDALSESSVLVRVPLAERDAPKGAIKYGVFDDMSQGGSGALLSGGEREVAHVRKNSDGSALMTFVSIFGPPQTRYLRAGGVDLALSDILAGTSDTGAAARSASGHIYVATEASGGEIVRYSPTGARDLSFSSSGWGGQIRWLFLQPNGSLVVIGAGLTYEGAINKTALRLWPDGALDRSFNLGADFASVESVASVTDAELRMVGVREGESDRKEVVIDAGTATDSAPTVSLHSSRSGWTGHSRGTLRAHFTGYPAPSLQWFRNGVAIPGANQRHLLLPLAGLTDAAGFYQVKATNRIGARDSSGFLVTTSADPIGTRDESFTPSPPSRDETVHYDLPGVNALSVTGMNPQGYLARRDGRVWRVGNLLRTHSAFSGYRYIYSQYVSLWNADGTEDRLHSGVSYFEIAGMSIGNVVGVGTNLVQEDQSLIVAGVDTELRRFTPDGSRDPRYSGTWTNDTSISAARATGSLSLFSGQAGRVIAGTLHINSNGSRDQGWMATTSYNSFVAFADGSGFGRRNDWGVETLVRVLNSGQQDAGFSYSGPTAGAWLPDGDGAIIGGKVRVSADGTVRSLGLSGNAATALFRMADGRFAAQQGRTISILSASGTVEKSVTLSGTVSGKLIGVDPSERALMVENNTVRRYFLTSPAPTPLPDLRGAAFMPGGPLRLQALNLASTATIQWFRAGVPIPGATHARLEVPEAGLHEARAFTVMIGGSNGSTMSDPVEAPVILPEDFVELTPAGLTFRIPAKAGVSYSIEASSRFSDWEPVLAVVAAEDATLTRTIDLPEVDKFYRVRSTKLSGNLGDTE